MSLRTLLYQLPVAIKSTVRNFQKNWLYGTLNLLGLSIAFGSMLLIAGYLYHETTYERFNANAGQIYRATYRFDNLQDYSVHFARVPVNFINSLPEEFPEIETLIRFQNQEQKYVRIGEKRFKPKHAYVTDQEVFEVFDFEMISGNPETALANPGAVVLTESTARKYFSHSNVIGEEIRVIGDWTPDEELYTVAGVMKDVPANTHLPIEMLLSFDGEEARTGWAYIYLLLANGAKIETVESRLPEFVRKHSDPESQSELSFVLQPLTDIHLHSNLAREIVPNGQILYVRIFLWVGVFLWLIALVNFANLSTALAMRRGKEMGVRKVLGATNRNLALFTITEAIIYSLIGFLVGVGLATLTFPFFSGLTGATILPPLQFVLPGAFGLVLITGLIAGIFPALFVASLKMLDILKEGKNWSLKKNTSGINLKRIMLTLQFCATLILVAGALLAFTQFRYLNNKNLGLDSEQIMAIPELPDNVKTQFPIFKQRISQLAGVRDVAACMQVPSSEIRDVGPVLVRGVNEDPEQAPMMDVQIVDPDFIKMMNLELLAGEDFTKNTVLHAVPEFSAELTPAKYLLERPRKYLINETAMRKLGWQDPEEAIGQQINWSIGGFELAYGPITGILKDYHQESLKNTVDPIVMLVEPIWLGNFLIKLETINLDKTITEIRSIWSDMFPYAMEFAFLDEMYHRLYTQDRLQLKLLAMLALIAILISFIGLAGLVAYALKSRAREMAIRRVVGASTASLATHIGREYLWVLALAALIGIPLSYVWIKRWLENFAYHVGISPVVYLLAIGLLLLLLIVFIYLQTMRATSNNPVNALRNEG